MTKTELIEGYESAKETYTQNLRRLQEMAKILSGIDVKSPALAKIDEAARLGNVCVRRIDSICKSLKENDSRHLDSQSRSLMADCKRYEDLAAEIDQNIKQVRAAVMSGSKSKAS